MTKRDLLCVALIILGVVSLLRGTTAIPGTILRIRYYNRAQREMVMSQRTRTAPDYAMDLALNLGYPAAFLMGGILLLTYAAAVSDRLIRDDRVMTFPSTGQWEKPLFGLSLRIVGAIWLIRYVPFVIKYVVLNIYRNLSVPVQSPEWSNLAGGVVVVAIGIYLLMGAKHLVNFVFRKRKAESVSTD